MINIEPIMNNYVEEIKKYIWKAFAKNYLVRFVCQGGKQQRHQILIL